jgi:predicted GNAT family N-acyltransferase
MERRIDRTNSSVSELQPPAASTQDDAEREPASDLAKASQLLPAVGADLDPATTGSGAEPSADSAGRSPALAAGTGAPQYELRALTTEAELYESYQLRYEVYGALGYLQCFNRSKVELDVYDRASIPFGAFDTRTGDLVGTLRLITTEPQPEYDALIDNVLTECFEDDELHAQAAAPRSQPLPAIGCAEIDRSLHAFNRDRYSIHELSRFIVHPGHRYSHVSRSLVQLAMAYAMQFGPAVFIAGCLPRNLRLNASYGFIRLPDTGLHHYDSVGQLACTIVCRSDVLPPMMQSQIEGLLRSMASGATEHTHEISRDSRARFRFAAPAPGPARCTE